MSEHDIVILQAYEKGTEICWSWWRSGRISKVSNIYHDDGTISRWSYHDEPKVVKFTSDRFSTGMPIPDHLNGDKKA